MARIKVTPNPDASTYFIDATNICHWGKEMSLQVLLQLLLEILRKKESFFCIFDANTSYYIPDNEKKIYKKLLEHTDRFYQVSGGKRADDFILELANRHGSAVISNDNYSDPKYSKYKWKEREAEPMRLFMGEVIPVPSGDHLILFDLEINVILTESTDKLYRKLTRILYPPRAKFEGNVKFVNNHKGWGRIVYQIEDEVNFRTSELPQPIEQGQRVNFFIEETDKGEYARSIELLEVDEQRIKGRIVQYDENRGMGAIKPETGGDDLFFYKSYFDDPENIPKISKNQRVSYVLGSNSKGECAKKIQIAEEDPRDVQIKLLKDRTKYLEDKLRNREEEIKRLKQGTGSSPQPSTGERSKDNAQQRPSQKNNKQEQKSKKEHTPKNNRQNDNNENPQNKQPNNRQNDNNENPQNKQPNNRQNDNNENSQNKQPNNRQNDNNENPQNKQPNKHQNKQRKNEESTDNRRNNSEKNRNDQVPKDSNVKENPTENVNEPSKDSNSNANTNENPKEKTTDSNKNQGQAKEKKKPTLVKKPKKHIPKVAETSKTAEDQQSTPLSLEEAEKPNLKQEEASPKTEQVSEPKNEQAKPKSEEVSTKQTESETEKPVQKDQKPPKKEERTKPKLVKKSEKEAAQKEKSQAPETENKSEQTEKPATKAETLPQKQEKEQEPNANTKEKSEEKPKPILVKKSEKETPKGAVEAKNEGAKELKKPLKKGPSAKKPKKTATKRTQTTNSKKNDQEKQYSSWWKSLEKQWQMAFNVVAGNGEIIARPSNEQIENLLKSKRLSFYRTSKNKLTFKLTNLTGLRELAELQTFNVAEHLISNLRGTDKLTKLHTFNCNKNQLKTLKGIENMKMLRQFSCVGNELQINNFSNISEQLPALAKLDARNNNLSKEDKKALQEATKGIVAKF